MQVYWSTQLETISATSTEIWAQKTAAAHVPATLRCLALRPHLARIDTVPVTCPRL